VTIRKLSRISKLNDLFDFALRNVADADMVGITMQNEVNILDKAI
jgi:hypothetical protein